MNEKLLNKLKLIYERAEGEKRVGNEEAANAHAELLRKLLAKHRIEMSTIEEVDIESEDPIDIYEFDWSDHGLPNVQRRCGWIEQLAHVVTVAHGCRFMIRPGTNCIIFVSRKSAAMACEYVLVTLVRTARQISETEYCRFFQECSRQGQVHLARGYKKSWLVGFCRRVKERFDEERLRGTENERAIVLFRNDLAVVDEFLKGKTRTASQLNNSSSNPFGYSDGKKFADSVNLKNNGIEK